MLPHRLRHCSAGNQCRRPARLAGRLPLAGLSPVNSRTDLSVPKHSQIPSFLCIDTNSGLRSDLDPRSCCRSAGRPILDPTASSLRSCSDRNGTSLNSDTIGLRQSARRRATAFRMSAIRRCSLAMTLPSFARLLPLAFVRDILRCSRLSFCKYLPKGLGASKTCPSDSVTICLTPRSTPTRPWFLAGVRCFKSCSSS